MAHTETRPGFRLPWTAERTEPGTVTEDPGDAPPVDQQETDAEELVTPDMIDATTSAPARRPTKFMADLSRAMQATAESSRDETLAHLGADAKTVIEGIHAGAAAEATALRRSADDDIAAVREWSKAEIARIREETEARITTRKTALDEEVEAHAATIDGRVQRVTAAVAAFEAEMAGFFERLATEEDPTRIATMAETMPDPPDLEQVAAAGGSAELPSAVVATEAATGSGTAGREAVAGGAIRPAAPTAPDFEAAEAEAAASIGQQDEDTSEATARDDAVAPRAVDPTGADADTSPVATRTTRVVVLGLVSVASIATFKRSLARTLGVSAIGVASGPDGEFVFTVDHDVHLSLDEAIVALPGFEARIVAATATQLEVAAHDPDSGD